MRLAGRHALVTGASHGIGVCLARQFRDRGARLTVLGRDAARLAAVAEEVGGHPLVVDLADPEALADVVDRAEAANGPLDVLLNNAALALVEPARSTGPGVARRMMQVNAAAPMELCGQALPGMLSRGRGQLVNVSSLAGVSAVPDMSVYGASKAALHHYTSVARRELEGTGVTMSLVTLAEVAGTHMMEEARRSPVIAEVSRRLSRLMPTLTPEVVAARITDAVEREVRVATIPRRLGAVIALRDLPSTLQDLFFVGIPRTSPDSAPNETTGR